MIIETMWNQHMDKQINRYKRKIQKKYIWECHDWGGISNQYGKDWLFNKHGSHLEEI